MLAMIIKKIIKKLPIIPKIYRNLRDSLPLRYEPKYRPHLGFKFNGTKEMEGGSFEPLETNFFKKNIDNYDVCINVGANMGYYSLIAMSRKKNVIAFEPNSLNSQIFMHNVLANKFEDLCEFYPIALSNLVGILPMYGFNTGASLIKGWAGQYNSKLVPVNRLDNIISNKNKKFRTFMLVDIEGAEYEFLLGARNFLVMNMPILLMIEISVTEHQPEAIGINPNIIKTFELFFEVGYSCYALDKDFSTVTLEEIKSIYKTGVNTLKTHNFVFLNKFVDSSSLNLNF